VTGVQLCALPFSLFFVFFFRVSSLLSFVYISIVTTSRMYAALITI